MRKILDSKADPVPNAPLDYFDDLGLRARSSGGMGARGRSGTMSEHFVRTAEYHRARVRELEAQMRMERERDIRRTQQITPNPPPVPVPAPVPPPNPNHDPDLRKKCDDIRAEYKAARKKADEVPRLRNYEKGSSEYCAALGKMLEGVQKEVDGRQKFGDANCDSDTGGWNDPLYTPNPDGKTEKERRDDHEGALQRSKDYLDSLKELQEKWCKPKCN